MTSITIYGASDDLIEICGDLSEEFTALGEADTDDGALLAISDGTVLRIRYDGVWRIAPVVRGRATVTIEQAPENDDDNYSDRATLTQADTDDESLGWWVVMGAQLART